MDCVHVTPQDDGTQHEWRFQISDFGRTRSDRARVSHAVLVGVDRSRSGTA